MLKKPKLQQREFEVNVAYRWFLGLKLREKVPDARLEPIRINYCT